MADTATTKAYREAYKPTLERLKREIIGLGWKGCVNSSDLDVMIQVMEVIQNQNHTKNTKI